MNYQWILNRFSINCLFTFFFWNLLFSMIYDLHFEQFTKLIQWDPDVVMISYRSYEKATSDPSLQYIYIYIYIYIFDSFFFSSINHRNHWQRYLGNLASLMIRIVFNRWEIDHTSTSMYKSIDTDCWNDDHSIWIISSLIAINDIFLT